MANDNTKPQSGNAGTGARVGDAGQSGDRRDPGSAGERGGDREGSQSDTARREPADTKAPRRRP